VTPRKYTENYSEILLNGDGSSWEGSKKEVGLYLRTAGTRVWHFGVTRIKLLRMNLGGEGWRADGGGGGGVLRRKTKRARACLWNRSWTSLAEVFVQGFPGLLGKGGGSILRTHNVCAPELWNDAVADRYEKWAEKGSATLQKGARSTYKDLTFAARGTG